MHFAVRLDDELAQVSAVVSLLNMCVTWLVFWYLNGGELITEKDLAAYTNNLCLRHSY